MKYYSTHRALTQGILYINLKDHGKDYYFNENSDGTHFDTYIHKSHVFKEYDDALARFLEVVDAKLAKYRTEISWLESLRDSEAEG